ncbi:type I polyketide synthase [Aspergillus stella-maris]|uniref:type I polyketide synthase n=1 Tax=Aspergillus stella-maris TaxID=1810926 RepID=UPI003CCCA4D2
MSTTSTSSTGSTTNRPSPTTPCSEPQDMFSGVAIVGMACRVAGDVQSPQQLWEFILSQRDGSSNIPTERWAPYYARDHRNKRILDNGIKRGYFVQNIDDFDCQFFGISPKEAEQMDPQQRLSLEVAWEALQDAGIPAGSLKGTNTAVFWGVNSDDYSKLVLEDLLNVDAWMGIGTSYCGVPNRISYHLDIVGPSAAVDAACASSLVAVHNGVTSILAGESETAIVGGVNALYGPGLTTVLQRAGALSADGRCRSFDDGAKGYGRGEGAGAVVLKRYEAAVRDGDHVLALVKGSAVAHDGKTNGIMAPNGIAQTMVAEQALKVANLNPEAVQYIEAHATSTPLGDPTELSAMRDTYGVDVERPRYIGSIKPNIGHLEAGAGVMGVIKAVLALQNAVLPPQANLETLNTRVDWEASGLEVVRSSRDWPKCDTRRAAVCSYGYGGTVSHAVLEHHPLTCVPVLKDTSSLSYPTFLLVSAPQRKRLSVIAESLLAWFKSNATEDNLMSICKALATRRDQYEFRSSALIENASDALGFLEALRRGTTTNLMTEGRCLAVEHRDRTVWAFSGHGAQWTNMGKQLLHNKIFLQAISSLDETVHGELQESPIDWLRNGDFESTDRVQILTYIMQIGISAILQSKGLFPDAIIGHSVGEIAASVVAGALSSVEGALIVTRRAILYRRLMGQGAMILVNTPFQEFNAQFQDCGDVVAAIDSSPSSCVAAGSTDAVASVAEIYKHEGVKTFSVRTDIAFHSPMMDALSDDLLKALDGTLNPQPPTVKLYSTALADIRSPAPRDASYWASNMVNPVRLTTAVRGAVADGYRVFLEVSSHPVISHSITETLLDSGVEDFAVVPTLRRDQNAEKSILHSLCQLHCNGVDIDWASQMPGPWAPGLPPIPWLHQRIVPKISSGGKGMKLHEPTQHTLVGHKTTVAGTDTTVYSTLLEKESKPFPGDHPVSGTEIVPAACLLNTFMKASSGRQLGNIQLKVPVAVDVPRNVQVVVQASQLKILSRLSGRVGSDESTKSSWLAHTTAAWKDAPDSTAETVDLSKLNIDFGPPLSDSFTIDYLARVGVSAMGFPWKVVQHYGDATKMLARVDVAPDMETPDWDASSWAPLLDAATSIGSSMFFQEERLRMPSKIDHVNVFTTSDPPKIAWIHVTKNSKCEECSDVGILNDAGHVLVRFVAMQFSGIEGKGMPGSRKTVEDLVHRVAWTPATPAEEPLKIDRVLLVRGDTSPRPEALTELSKNVDLLEVSGAEGLYALTETTWAHGTVVAYIPTGATSLEEVSTTARQNVWQLLEIMKFAINNRTALKVFVLTTNAIGADSLTALAQDPLVGLSRVISGEHPDNFGGLFDCEDRNIPLTAMKYIQAADVVRILDGVPRTARLRSLPKQLRSEQAFQSLPRPEGTYLISGGLGPLGLATAEFLAEHGARRLVLISRRAIPLRRSWPTADSSFDPIIDKLQQLEKQGLSIHTLSLDITSPDASKELLTELDRLNLPPVLGVVHAAGVLENEMILDSTQDAFSRVLYPKIDGVLALHRAFPPGTVDFFMMFSSCGQLFGFPGQGSYGSGNAFLDGLATYRRNLGDNARSFQWSSWRGMGMGSDSDFVAAELESKGITDITRDEAFQAWLHLAEYDIDHGVVLRSRTIGVDEPLPSPLLRDIISRSAREQGSSSPPSQPKSSDSMPPSGPELNSHLDAKIRACVGSILHLDPGDVDSRAALSDLGLDSVMSVGFRRQLTQTFKVQIPPTITWNHPTVGHLVKWFAGKVGK